MSASYYGEIERGDRRLNSDTATKLSRALPLGPVFSNDQTPAVPQRLAIAAQESEGRPDGYDRPEPHDTLPAPKKFRDRVDCFAAEIVDDSADLDFARETVLFLLPIRPEDKLTLGSKIVVRFYTEPRSRQPKTAEVLYGVLDRTVTGDLVLLTRTRNRHVPASLVIQREPMASRGFSERVLSLIPRKAEVEYQPRADDEAEIVGTVVHMTGPV
jgi:hypothetical protein